MTGVRYLRYRVNEFAVLYQAALRIDGEDTGLRTSYEAHLTQTDSIKVAVPAPRFQVRVFCDDGTHCDPAARSSDFFHGTALELNLRSIFSVNSASKTKESFSVV